MTLSEEQSAAADVNRSGAAVSSGDLSRKAYYA